MRPPTTASRPSGTAPGTYPTSSRYGRSARVQHMSSGVVANTHPDPHTAAGRSGVGWGCWSWDIFRPRVVVPGVRAQDAVDDTSSSTSSSSSSSVSGPRTVSAPKFHAMPELPRPRKWCAVGIPWARCAVLRAALTAVRHGIWRSAAVHASQTGPMAWTASC